MSGKQVYFRDYIFEIPTYPEIRWIYLRGGLSNGIIKKNTGRTTINTSPPWWRSYEYIVERYVRTEELIDTEKGVAEVFGFIEQVLPNKGIS